MKNLPRNGLFLKSPPGKVVVQVLKSLIAELPFQVEDREEVEEWLWERFNVAKSDE